MSKFRLNRKSIVSYIVNFVKKKFRTRKLVGSNFLYVNNYLCTKYAVYETCKNSRPNEKSKFTAALVDFLYFLLVVFGTFLREFTQSKSFLKTIYTYTLIFNFKFI